MAAHVIPGPYGSTTLRIERVRFGRRQYFIHAITRFESGAKEGQTEHQYSGSYSSYKEAKAARLTWEAGIIKLNGAMQ